MLLGIDAMVLDGPSFKDRIYCCQVRKTGMNLYQKASVDGFKDPKDKVVNTNTFHMLLIWGSLGYLSQWLLEESLWKQETLGFGPINDVDMYYRLRSQRFNSPKKNKKK